MKTWTVEPEESTLVPNVQAWTKSLDRGGLLHSSPHFFQFMKVVEILVRELLNTKTIASFAGENVVPTILGKVKAMVHVQEAFKALVGYHLSSEELCEGLLDELLVKWIQCKARRAVENYTFELKTKRKGKACRSETAAMRKTLDKI